jgi:hypothetical protein
MSRGVSELQIFPSVDSNREITAADIRRITLPPDAKVRIGEREIVILCCQTKIVGPWDGGYELLDWGHRTTPCPDCGREPDTPQVNGLLA